MTEPLDPAAIRAALRFDYGPRLGDGSWNDDQDEDVIALLDERDRLAADLAEAERKLAAVEALHGHSIDPDECMECDMSAPAHQEAPRGFPCRTLAALGGDHAA